MTNDADNPLVVERGEVFLGIVAGGKDDATLAFASGFALTNDGTIVVDSGALVFGAVGEDPGNTGVIGVGSNGVAEFQDTVGAGQTLSFSDASGTIKLDNPAGFSATISGLQAGDTIDLTNTPATNLVYAGGVLSVFNGPAAVAALTIAGSYTASAFALTSDGHGGNAITLPGDPASSSVVGGGGQTAAVAAPTSNGLVSDAITPASGPAAPNLINGLGGPAGFGTNILQGNDDGSTAAISITSVFPAGLDFFGHTYTSLYINNNGNITFNAPNGTFTPFQITANTSIPIIAPYFADVDTRGGPGTSTGGNATGSNLVYWNLDTVSHNFTATWDDVGYFSAHTNKLDAFQVQLIDESASGAGNFDIEFIYEAINWTTGDASGGSNGLGGTVARAGFSAGDGVNFFELPQSGNQSAMLGLPTTPAPAGTPGATADTGVYIFRVRNGVVLPTYDWDAGSGTWNGSSGADWNPPGNGTVPSSTSDVTIGTGPGGTVTLAQDQTIDSLLVTNLYTLSGGGSSITTSGNASVAAGGALILDNMFVGGSFTVAGSATFNGVLTSVGTITVGGVLTLTSGTINDSTLAGAGTIQSATFQSTLDNVTIDSGTTYTVNNNSSTVILGTITNSGTIRVNATAHQLAGILFLGGDVTLNGGGTVVLSTALNGPFAALLSNGATLTNVDNVIQGAGVIGNGGGLALVNSGTIDATISGGYTALTLNGSGGLINNGTFEATNFGVLDVMGAVAGAGQLRIGAASEIELRGATSQNVTFLGASNATLRIDNARSTAYGGVIAGFTAGDILELGNTVATSVTPTLNGSNTILSVNLSSGGPLTFTMAGDLTADTFNVTSGTDSVITLTLAPPSTLYNFVFTYNDGKDYYYGTVSDDRALGYHVGQQITTASGRYDIFSQEGVTGQASGTVFVTYYSHDGLGQASYTPLRDSQGLADGSHGLGSESDSILGTDGLAHPFSATSEAAISTSGLYGFVFNYSDGAAYYYGAVADNGTYGYAAIANSASPYLFVAGGYYDIFSEGTTGNVSGTVIVSGYRDGSTATTYTADRTINGVSDGSTGLGSESANFFVNGTLFNFTDIHEAVDPTAPTPVSAPGTSDILWEGADGTLMVFNINNDQITTALTIGQIGAEWHAVGIAKFNAGDTGDILWERADGTLMALNINNNQVTAAPITGQIGAEWHPLGIGDFNGDGTSGILWEGTDGTLMALNINNNHVTAGPTVGQIGAEWHALGIGDFNGDGTSDILWERADGTLMVSNINNDQVTAAPIIGHIGAEWHALGIGDFNSDGTSGILWEGTNGTLMVLNINNNQVTAARTVGQIGAEWHFYGVGDFHHNGTSDVLWQRTDGTSMVFDINNDQVTGAPIIGSMGAQGHLFM